MSDTVKTYRVIRDELKVGHSVRHYGDLIPEAADWPNTAAYERSHYIEVVYVPKSELDAHYERVAEEARELAAAEEEQAEIPKPKKRVVRKKNKTTKEISDGGSEERSEDLAEVSV